MGNVAKYNLFKGISTIATVGTPMITLLCCSNVFVERPETTVSATGIFAILLFILLFKDKIAENFKLPSAFILSTVIFVLILLIENIIEPLKIVAMMTMISSGVDEITFKQVYKRIELRLPEAAKSYKYVGFLFVTSKKLIGEQNNENEVKHEDRGTV